MITITEKNANSYNLKAKEWAEKIQTEAGHKYLEKPAMEKELPDVLTGKSVLCIGVGSGYELDAIIKRKPAKVVGIDTAEELLKIAATKYPGIEFREMDMMHLSFPDGSFDYIYSSLTFHYADDWDALLKEVRRVIRTGGTLLFSTHHPKYWSQKQKTGKYVTNKRDVVLTEHTATLPAGKVDITFYNHPNEQSIVDSLEQARFQIMTFTAAKVEQLTGGQNANLNEPEHSAYRRLQEKNQKSPLFLIVRVKAA